MLNTKEKESIDYELDELFEEKTTTPFHYDNFVANEIIKHFAKLGNLKILPKNQPDWVYNFNELCYIIDSLANLNLLHKVWYSDIVEDEYHIYKVNFEEYL